MVGLEVYLSCKQDGKDSSLYHSVELAYDYKNQYPYYKFFASKGDSIDLNIVFRELPPTGFIYIYSLNVSDSPQMRAIFDIEKTALTEGKTKPFTLPLSELSYFSVAFANKEIADIGDRLKNMELTFGSFLFRQNSILGNDLLWPNRKWHFHTLEKLGFEIEKGLVSGEARLVVPVTFKITSEN